MTALSPHADDFVRGFGDGFGEYLVQWERAIRRHIVDCVPMGNEMRGPDRSQNQATSSYMLIV